MKKIIQKPHLFFLALVPIVLISGLLNKDDSILFNVHDIYIVIDVFYMSILSAIFFFLVFINYYVLFANKKPLKRTLTVLHIVLQVIALIPMLIFFFTADTEMNIGYTIDMNAILGLGFMVFLLATVIHFINFFISLLSKKQ